MTDISSKALGKYIRSARESREISREELAERLHISYEALAKYEAGRRVPDFGMIGRIAEELGITVQDIYDHAKVTRSDVDASLIISVLVVAVFVAACVIGLLHRGDARQELVPGAVEQTSESGERNESSEKLITLERTLELCKQWEAQGENGRPFFDDITILLDAEVDTPGEEITSGLASAAYWLDTAKKKQMVVYDSKIYLRMDLNSKGTEHHGAVTLYKWKINKDDAEPADQIGYLSVEKAFDLCKKWESGFKNTGNFPMDIKRIFDESVNESAKCFGSEDGHWAYYVDAKEEWYIMVEPDGIYLVPSGRYIDSGERLYMVKKNHNEIKETEIEKATYMSVELAKKICAGFTFTEETNIEKALAEARRMFDEAVEVKGVDKGCGLPLYEYYVDDTKQKLIRLNYNDVAYVDLEKMEAELIYEFPKKETPEIDLFPVDTTNHILLDSYDKADETQKKKLEQLEETYGKYACYYEKEIKTIMGELPENQPRITLDQAREISLTYVKDALETESGFFHGTEILCEKFNAIAGAPDYADTYFENYRYYLDGDDGYYVQIGGNASFLYNEKGEELELLSEYIEE